MENTSAEYNQVHDFHSPSPTYQWTNARLAYIRSNLWSRRAHASAIAVVLLIMQIALWTGARSPPKQKWYIQIITYFIIVCMQWIHFGNAGSWKWLINAGSWVYFSFKWNKNVFIARNNNNRIKIHMSLESNWLPNIYFQHNIMMLLYM